MEIKYNNGVVYLTPELASFVKVGDFLGVDLTGDISRLNESALDAPRLPHYDRVRLRRAFPFSLGDKYISVLDFEQNEIGLIEDISAFPEKQAQLIRNELERVYYSPRVTAIKSVKERLGYAFFAVDSDVGALEIPLRDVYRSLIRIGDDRLVIIDTDGNRYYIDSIKALDKTSQKKLELYV
ncbi:MAG: DUF1854 domain-containing protein [Clostridia bacterium]|nr:DUF1854 domain-containing protein [Clostridia bacterium]